MLHNHIVVWDGGRVPQYPGYSERGELLPGGLFRAERSQLADVPPISVERPDPNSPLCRCGCGLPVEFKRTNGVWRHYRPEHASRRYVRKAGKP